MSHTARRAPVIQVSVPAEAAFLRVLRVAAATAIADRVSMQLLDAARLAIDELAAAVVDAVPPGSVLRVDMHVGPDTLSVHGRVRADGGTPRLSEVGELLVRTICRDHETRRSGEDLVFGFTMDLDGSSTTEG